MAGVWRRAAWVAAGAVILGATLVVALSTTNDDSSGESSLCRLADRRTVVECGTAHHWEAVGSTDLTLNLAEYTPYPTEPAMWFVIYQEDCTKLATEAVHPDQMLGADLSVVGVPISMPTLDEWRDGDRVAVCAVGVETSADAQASPRSATVSPVIGTGSLVAGDWIAVNP